MKTNNRGYVGLLALLVSFALIMLFMWYSYFRDVPTVKDGKTMTVIDQDRQAIKAAESAKALLESKSRDAAAVQ